jgi:putative Mg2+ transporter-C (MgtC) family protein
MILETILETNPHLDFFLKSVIALVFGLIIGFERQTKGKPAGIKTHALISLGAMMLTFLSINISIFSDPSRIAAQIVSGIGFIGAGTIFMSKHRVQGLTSAATVWASSAMGMIVGAGYIFYAYISLCLMVTLFFLTTPKKGPSKKTYTIHAEIMEWDAVERVTTLIDKFRLTVYHKSLKRDDGIHITISYTALPLTQHLFTKKLFQLEGLGTVVKL